MISPELRAEYTVTIGIECHVQLKTRTKLFSAADNDAREAAPNTLVNHIDFGLPGALPVLNKKAVELASKAAFALGTTPQKFSKFDRKHYFYPDLPMGYQITQFDEPIVLGGHVDITVDGEPKTIRITRAHLEADAGKSTHPAGTDYSLVDLNRAGTPLLEIVSEPDMHSAAEAKAYAHELHLLMRYADVSEANLYYGNMRFDVNVSVSKDDRLGTRTETKNLNSFRSVERAVEYEVERQIAVLEDGGEVVQETRGWDDDKQVTFSQRSKEDAHDYRYMPDPDLPPVVLTDEYIAKVKSSMGLMPEDIRKILRGFKIEQRTIEELLELENEFRDKNISFIPVFQTISNAEDAKFYADWQLNVFTPLLRSEHFSLGKIDYLQLESGIYELMKAKKISSTNARKLFEELITQNAMPSDIEAYSKEKGYAQESDEGAIMGVVKQVLAENPKAAGDVQNGEMKAIGFLVGQVMKLSQGKANPAMATDLIKKQLGI